MRKKTLVGIGTGIVGLAVGIYLLFVVPPQLYITTGITPDYDPFFMLREMFFCLIIAAAIWIIIPVISSNPEEEKR